MNKKQILCRVLMCTIGIVLALSLFSALNHFKLLSTKLSYIAESTASVVEATIATTTLPLLPHYIEVTSGCDTHFVGDCVNMRSGPGTEYPVVVHLRTGVVLRVGDIVTAKNGTTWYKIVFTHELLYPERVKGNWYVSTEFVQLITSETDHELVKGEKVATTTKRIVVDLSEEKLYAYDGDQLFMEEPISAGLELTPTQRGTFTIFKMTPSRFMQGPIPGVSDQVYDLPGVPWNLYWHDHFGKPWSHGCVNMSPVSARKLYDWAEVGMKVTVQK